MNRRFSRRRGPHAARLRRPRRSRRPAPLPAAAPLGERWLFDLDADLLLPDDLGGPWGQATAAALDLSTLRFRDHSPALGRWLGPDPLGFAVDTEPPRMFDATNDLPTACIR